MSIDDYNNLAARYVSTAAGINGVGVVTISLLLGISLFRARREGDPSRTGFAWLKLTLLVTLM